MPPARVCASVFALGRQPAGGTPMIPSVGVFLRFVAAVFREIAVLAASPVKFSRGYAAYIRCELFEI